MEKGCIYCGKGKDLSSSDIIPDALTNAKIINPNVCRVEHNNDFSDLFEYEIINKLAFITNELDIKSSKSKNYPRYEVEINVDGVNYHTNISSETELFSGNKKMRSLDGKYLIGEYGEIRKIKNSNELNTKTIDINQMELEKRVKIDLSVFFSQAMYRMMAKIAFEWYCLNNEVNNKIDSFEKIIQFIVGGTGEGLVTIVSNSDLYASIYETMDFGSHTLLSYLGKDNSVNVLVSLFGMAIYNVRVCDEKVAGCENNVLFQRLTLEAKRDQFRCNTVENLGDIFINKFREVNLGNGCTVKIPKDLTDTTLNYQFFYLINYPLFQNNLRCVDKPDKKIESIILKYIEDILQASAVTIRGLKRFVKEHFKSLDKEVRLNKQGTNKQAMFLFYLLFIIGQSSEEIAGISDLNRLIKERFTAGDIIINEDLSCKLKEEILSNNDYPNIILKGAKNIDSWIYE